MLELIYYLVCQVKIILSNIFAEELHGKLEYYIKTRLPSEKVKLVRLPERQGLIRARLAGARAATADVLIFLDSHCEVVVQWCLFAICEFLGH